MSYYTVRRDDAELRVVICPKCKKPDVIKYDDCVFYTCEDFLLKLMKCNNEGCGVYFTFYREDGLSEINKEIAEIGLKNRHGDMQSDGKDDHGHSYYVAFKNKPETITYKEYERLMGYTQADEHPEEVMQDTKEMKDFRKWVKSMPSLKRMVENHNLVTNIDIDAVNYFE